MLPQRREQAKLVVISNYLELLVLQPERQQRTKLVVISCFFIVGCHHRDDKEHHFLLQVPRQR